MSFVEGKRYMVLWVRAAEVDCCFCKVSCPRLPCYLPLLPPSFCTHPRGSFLSKPHIHSPAIPNYSQHISWSFTSISTPFIPASHGHNSKPHLNLSPRHSPRESSNIDTGCSLLITNHAWTTVSCPCALHISRMRSHIWI